jgi:hypothetical protein
LLESSQSGSNEKKARLHYQVVLKKFHTSRTH